MKVDKAIEILKLNLKAAGTSMPQDCKAAFELGIEALKRIQKMRENNAFLSPPPLPGETPETDPS